MKNRYAKKEVTDRNDRNSLSDWNDLSGWHDRRTDRRKLGRQRYRHARDRRRLLNGLELLLKTALLAACIAAGAATIGMGTRLSAQELSGISKRKPFTINGEVGAEMSSFLSKPKSFNRPFSYLLNVSLNPAIYGIALPIQVSFGQNGFNFNHPFNILQITPSYKWIKAYIGRTGMTMSPYGLAGIGFDGAGVELTPDFLPVSFAAMFGRLQKEDMGDSLRPPVYRRLAYGLKADWAHGGQQIDVHFFHAWEGGKTAGATPDAGGVGTSGDAGGETAVPPASGAVPQRNFVLSWQGRFTIADLVTLGTEGGVSWLQNMPAPEDPLRDVVSRKASPGLSFKVRAQAYGAEVAYERQGERFYSMGRFYSGGDLESVSVGYSGDFKQQWRVSGRIGWQRDNLKKDRQNRMNRVAVDAQLHYTPDGCWDAFASYSNFMTHTRRLPMRVEPGAYVPIEHPDSLRNTQLSQQAQLRFNVRIAVRQTARPSDGRPNRRSDLPTGGSTVQTLSFDFSFQEAKTVGEQAMSDYFTAQLAHSAPLPKDSRIDAAWHAQAVYRPALKTAEIYTGPSVGFNKRFLEDKSLNLNARLQYDLGFGLRRLQSGLINLGAGVGYRFTKRHQIDVRLNLRQKHGLGHGHERLATDFLPRTDFTGTLRYAYRF